MQVASSRAITPRSIAVRTAGKKTSAASPGEETDSGTDEREAEVGRVAGDGRALLDQSGGWLIGIDRVLPRRMPAKNQPPSPITHASWG